MGAIKTDGLVLRFANYRDNDRMLTLLSPTMGKVDAIARGCRKPKSPLLNAAEPFSAGEYVLNYNRGHYSVTQCQIKDNFYELRLDYDRLIHGFYWLSLAESVAFPGQSANRLFRLALRALTFLNYSDLPSAMLTGAFEMHLMGILGSSPRMDSCVACGRQVEGAARFDPSLGGVVCASCPSAAQMLSNGARRIMLRVPKTSYDAVAKLEGHPDWAEAMRRFRPFLERHVDCNCKEKPALP